MTSRRRMEDSERWRAVGRIEAGQSITDVAVFFGVHHSLISRLWKHFQTTQTVVRRPVAGRPRITTPAEDRYIAIIAKRNRRATYTRVTFMVPAFIGKAISAATVRRRLHMNGLYARIPRVCVPLSVQSRSTRLQWCREHVNWNVSDRGNAMFTDESRFALEPDDKRVHRNQNLNKEHVKEEVKALLRANLTGEYELYHFVQQRLYRQFQLLVQDRNNNEEDINQETSTDSDKLLEYA
ncbi:Transposable element Tcb2 transposase, partial [Stegodyphus mimosarum]